MIGEKIIRGIIYKIKGNFVNEDYTIHASVIDPKDLRIKPTLDYINNVGTSYKYGTSIDVTYAILPDDDISALSLLLFWQRFFLSVSVFNENINPQMNK
jgi:hypothetical protein